MIQDYSEDAGREKFKNTFNSVAVIIPIFKPDDTINAVFESLVNQTHTISRLILIDSSPVAWAGRLSLETVACHFQIETIKIDSSDFDHGRTRNFGVSRVNNSEYIMFLTQDAILLPDCLEKLLSFLHTNSLGAVYARQIAREGATQLEVFERLFNYQSYSKVITGPVTSIDDLFFSDVCSIVKRDLFRNVGGFPNKIITAEDQILVSKILNSGFKVGYCAEALVKHSHKLNFWRTLKRYYDTGVMHKVWENTIPTHSVTSKGFAFVMLASKYLIAHSPTELPAFFGSTLGKFIGYHLGNRYMFIGKKYRPFFSANKAFWGNNGEGKI